MTVSFRRASHALVDNSFSYFLEFQLYLVVKIFLLKMSTELAFVFRSSSFASIIGQYAFALDALLVVCNGKDP
jgi:hypothetical protein